MKLKATFLGHQGWMLESAVHRLLIDPILCEYFRNSTTSRMWIHPPRAIDVSALGSIDSVYITHEHEDHFHIESLDRLDRGTRMLISGNCSGAAERILLDMGFHEVRRVFAMERHDLGGGMILQLFPPPVSPTEHWVLQPFVHCGDLNASFYNLVDCEPSEEFIGFCQREVRGPLGLVSVAYNRQSTPAVRDLRLFKPNAPTVSRNFEPARLLGAPLLLEKMPLMSHLAIVGGGFMDDGNPFGNFLEHPLAEAAKILERYSRGQIRVTAPVTGEAVNFEGGGQEVIPAAAAGFVRRSAAAEAHVAELLARDYQEDPFGFEYAPVTGVRTLSAPDRDDLEERLQQLARLLAVHPFTMEMIQHNASPAGEPYGTARMLLVVLDDAGPLLYEYAPAYRRFEPLHSDVPEFELAHRYPFGYECWGADLLGVLRSEVGVFEVTFYRSRAWRPDKEYICPTSFTSVFIDLMSPEIAMEETYAFYRAAYDRCAKVRTESPDPS